MRLTKIVPDEAKTTQADGRAVDLVLRVLCGLSLAFGLCAPWIGFHHSILDFHAFRQAQTAITAEQMLHGGEFLHYQTPVLGPPWSTPFEFPLYQWLVARLSGVFSAPLVETGRSVSIAFFYLCIFPLWSILAHIGLRGRGRIPAIALFASSPLYVFVSRAFMMESAALFFSLMYADQMLRLTIEAKQECSAFKEPGTWRWQHMLRAAIFGVLAGLVKVTTFAPYLALGVGLLAWSVLKSRKGKRMAVGAIVAAVLLSVLIPVGAVSRWTMFADAEKAQNPLTARLTSHALSAWNYGTLEERLRPKLYGYLVRDSSNYLGSFAMPALLLAAWFWFRRGWDRKAAVCALLYALPIAVFYNLFYIHEYYPYANAIFLLVGMGIMIASLAELPGAKAWVGVALLAVQLAQCGLRYWVHYYPIQSSNDAGRPQLAAIIDGTTGPTDVLLVLGDDWSSAIPYQTHRRAIMIPNPGSELQPYSVVREALPGVIERSGARNIGALLVCRNFLNDRRIPELLREAEMVQPVIRHADDCDVYERRRN